MADIMNSFSYERMEQKSIPEELELRKELQLKPIAHQIIPLLEHLKDLITWDSVSDMEEEVSPIELVLVLNELDDITIELSNAGVELHKQIALIVSTLKKRGIYEED
jgi:hypothetical protein